MQTGKAESTGETTVKKVVLDYYSYMLSLGQSFLRLLTGISQSPAAAADDSFLIAAVAMLFGAGLGALVVFYLFRQSRKPTRFQNEARVSSPQQAERDRLQALFQIISRMSNTLVYERVINLVLDVSGKAIATSEEAAQQLVSSVLIFFDDGQSTTHLRVASARRLTPSDQRLELPGVEGALAQAVNTAEPVFVRNIPADPELSRFVGLRSCKSAYCLPLRTGLDAYGVMIFAHPSEHFFGPTQRDVLEILAHQAIVAIQNAQLYKTLETEKERQLQVQEEARKKLARDLHDGPTQSIAAIAMRVNFARRLVERNLNSAKDELEKVEELARRTTKEIRHMLFTLRPLVLESEGLAAALRVMAEKIHETYDQNVSVEVDPAVVAELESSRQTVMFYIAEEAVNNARKHAQAAHIWVRIRHLQADVALLEIQDDGVGFNVGSVDASYDRRGSLGMVNMRERAELVSGILGIQSAEGKGTTIQVQIPLNEEAEDRFRRGG